MVEHRDRLVLKPTHDFGGHGVRLGWRESRSEWEDSIRKAIDSDYIAQHRVELHRHEYPKMTSPIERETYYEDIDPFLFRGTLGGMLSRLSPGELTNTHAQGSVVAPFAIAPR